MRKRLVTRLGLGECAGAGDLEPNEPCDFLWSKSSGKHGRSKREGERPGRVAESPAFHSSRSGVPDNWEETPSGVAHIVLQWSSANAQRSFGRRWRTEVNHDRPPVLFVECGPARRKRPAKRRSASTSSPSTASGRVVRSAAACCAAAWVGRPPNARRARPVNGRLFGSQVTPTEGRRRRR